MTTPKFDIAPKKSLYIHTKTTNTEFLVKTYHPDVLEEQIKSFFRQYLKVEPLKDKSNKKKEGRYKLKYKVGLKLMNDLVHTITFKIKMA